MDCKEEPVQDQMQLLTEPQPNFPQKLKQRIVFELSKVTNHFEFIGALLAKGVLSDGSNDLEENSSRKETMVQLAAMIACSEGPDGISGLMGAMRESGNVGLVAALFTWAEEEFGVDLGGLMYELQGQKSVLDTQTVHQLEQPAKTPLQLSSSGTKLIDKIMSSEEKDIMDQLESHLVENASKVSNAKEFRSSLVPQDSLREEDNNLETGQNSQVKATEQAIRAACSKRAIGSLVIALHRTHNEHILEETCEWLEALHARQNNYPIAVRSLPNYQNESKPARSAFFEQPAPLDDLEKVAVLNCQPDSSTKGTFSVEFNKDRMLVYLADGTVYLQNWRDNEEKTVEFGAKMKNITSFQYDEEICVLGTENGTVYLFDSKSLEAKWFVRLGKPVKSLKFVESKLVVVSRCPYYDNFWCVDISRTDMKLLNKRSVSTVERGKSGTTGVFIYQDYMFLNYVKVVILYDTQSGNKVRNKQGFECLLKAPAEIHTLSVVNLTSTKNYVVAGCANGLIAVWNFWESVISENPIKTLQGHTEAVVSLCSLNGHLLSVDKSGKLLMWSGYDLENNDNTPPVPQLLSEDLLNVNCLVAHDRWFSTSSSEDSNVSIWTLPDLWLLCG